MKDWLRRELWIVLIPFPVSLLIGKVVEFMLSPAQQNAARLWQSNMIRDLGDFTPIVLLFKIVDAAATAFDGWLFQFHRGFSGAVGAILTLPQRLFGTLLAFIGSVWQTETTFAAILVTLAFGFAILFALGTVSTRLEGWGVFAAIPATFLALAYGSLICTGLWFFSYGALATFGWFTDLAVVCTTCGGVAALGVWVAVNYAGFRVGRASEG